VSVFPELVLALPPADVLAGWLLYVLVGNVLDTGDATAMACPCETRDRGESAAVALACVSVAEERGRG
jgi:hypothetical protein